jgi:DNA-binding Lrp family transcriptional regulator
LRELLKNSKRSDRELAKVLKVSQPTITRTRHKLEQSGLIQDYTIVPNFRKMGFEILALTFVKMRAEILTPERMAEAREYAAEFPVSKCDIRRYRRGSRHDGSDYIFSQKLYRLPSEDKSPEN